MRTTEEVTHGDYRGVLQALVDARAPIPERLRDPDLDARDLTAGMGVSLIVGGAGSRARECSSDLKGAKGQAGVKR
jgi:hypothetical protein